MMTPVQNKLSFKCFLLIIFLFFIPQSLLYSQDPAFSQSYMSPLYLNPAAAGSGEHDLRITGIYRRQWWTIPSDFNYAAFSVDKFIPALKSGVGLLITNASEGYLKRTGLYASYAYTFCAGTASVASNGSLPKWFLTGSTEFGLAQVRVDYKNLLFADQIDANGEIPGSVTAADVPVNSGRWYPDFGAGIFFNYRFDDYTRFLIGGSAHHVNHPDESLISTNSASRSILPVRWAGNIMFTKTNTGQTWTYSIIGNGCKQANNNFLQIGVEVTQNTYDIGLGIWYRGSSTFKDPDVVSLSLSLNLSGRSNGTSKLRVGLAHDSPLGNKKYTNNTGSSEFGFTWDIDTYSNVDEDPCKPKITSNSACPELTNQDR